MAAPRYTLVLGDFFIRYPDLPRNGPEPDGDTINFLPDNDSLVRDLPRFSNIGPDRRHLGTYGVRFEGIDTLETHFNNQHQDLTFAVAARDHMLDTMGFGNVQFWADLPNKVETVEHHPIRGYLLANGIESNGRVLALVYPGPPTTPGVAGHTDGDRVFVDEPLLDGSLNADLVRAGLAYAELYSTMPIDLIHRIRELITTARTDNAGMWPTEHVTTTRRAAPTSVTDLSPLSCSPSSTGASSPTSAAPSAPTSPPSTAGSAPTRSAATTAHSSPPARSATSTTPTTSPPTGSNSPTGPKNSCSTPIPHPISRSRCATWADDPRLGQRWCDARELRGSDLPSGRPRSTRSAPRPALDRHHRAGAATPRSPTDRGATPSTQ